MRLACCRDMRLALLRCSRRRQPARADYDSSQTWFQALTPEERADAQSDLILLGDYPYLVDGQFGTGTYDALTDFQRGQGSPETGVLSAADQQGARRAAPPRSRPSSASSRSRTRTPRSPWRSRPALLTKSFKTGHGTKWTTPDGGMTVETIDRQRRTSRSPICSSSSTSPARAGSSPPAAFRTTCSWCAATRTAAISTRCTRTRRPGASATS